MRNNKIDRLIGEDKFFMENFMEKYWCLMEPRYSTDYDAIVLEVYDLEGEVVFFTNEYDEEEIHAFLKNQESNEKLFRELDKRLLQETLILHRLLLREKYE